MSKEMIARRAALMFQSGSTINLGAGLPLKANKYIPEGVNVILQAENGILGSAALPAGQVGKPYEVDAGGFPICIQSGGAILDSATAFGLIRGGHLDMSVLGAMQVDAEGSLANWLVPGGKLSGMGGAMDLIVGARQVVITTEHCSKDGSPKLVAKCSFPLTGYRLVDWVITELGVFRPSGDRYVITEIAPGVTLEEVQAKTGAPVTADKNLCEMRQ